MCLSSTFLYSSSSCLWKKSLVFISQSRHYKHMATKKTSQCLIAKEEVLLESCLKRKHVPTKKSWAAKYNYTVLSRASTGRCVSGLLCLLVVGVKIQFIWRCCLCQVSILIGYEHFHCLWNPVKTFIPCYCQHTIVVAWTTLWSATATVSKLMYS